MLVVQVELRLRGVEVEVVYPLPASTPRIQKAEELVSARPSVLRCRAEGGGMRS